MNKKQDRIYSASYGLCTNTIKVLKLTFRDGHVRYSRAY